MNPGFFVLPGLAAALLVAATVAAFVADRRRLMRALRTAMTQRDRVLMDECAAIRALRLGAIELRGPAMTLLGHADRLCADGGRGQSGDGRSGSGQNGAGQNGGGHNGASQLGATIGAIAHQMLDLADDLQHHALADAASRVVREEPTRLAVVLKDAITVVQAGLEPSRRQWLLPPDIDAIELSADRRALGQILTRVLANAARFSRLDDWIDISFEFDGGHFTLLVADEGIGLGAAGHAGTPGPADSRGLGLGLALARVLMEAHGGALRVEAVPSVGTRVRLEFPMRCLLRMALSAPAAAPIDAPVGVPIDAAVSVPFGVPVGAPADAPAGVPAGTPLGIPVRLPVGAAMGV